MNQEIKIGDIVQLQYKKYHPTNTSNPKDIPNVTDEYVDALVRDYDEEGHLLIEFEIEGIEYERMVDVSQIIKK